MHRTLGLATALLVAGLSAQADPLTLGQRAAGDFLGGDVAAIWSDATPDMQQAFGSAADLAALRDEVLAEFGTEDTVLSETTAAEGGHDVYTRVSRWTGAPDPLEIIIAFDEGERIAGFLVRPQPVAAPSPFLDYVTKADLRLPVEGEWFVYWGGREIGDNYHAADSGQRFAMDLLVLRDGQSHAGDPAALDSYHCWDRPILSPGDGVVIAAVDGLPDQAIGATDLEQPLGNHVVVDFGNDEFGFLAHLRHGSLRVAAGDTVTAGQEIGRCGNSGNTTEPHLHFHLQTDPALGLGQGLPAQFLNYLADDRPVSRGEPLRGEIVQPAD